jgi:hypothetical protein
LAVNLVDGGLSAGERLAPAPASLAIEAGFILTRTELLPTLVLVLLF